jgi:hypothetical protein
VLGTCALVLEHKIFQDWNASSGDDLLWISADPGCGKLVLSRALINEKLIGSRSSTLCHFFFKDNEEQDDIATAFCALLYQLFCAHEHLLKKYATSVIEREEHALKNEFELLWSLFLSATTGKSAGDIICVLDALDECRQPDRNKLITRLENFYSKSLGQKERQIS